ncbi:P-loop containing nucleoside triphosphate hydrolase protein [Mycena leptocephala]|nr:P-loop containing nucleoside triphosphate hydrolase protein [Mycena leptocephala]
MLGEGLDLQTVHCYMNVYGGTGGSGGISEWGAAGNEGVVEAPIFHITRSHLTMNTDIAFVPESVPGIDECPPPSAIFQGRRNILDEMQQYFSQNRGQCHVSVLHGLGGAGKTQTALKFLDENNELFLSVFFVDASTIGTLDLSFKKLATAKRAGSTNQDALRWMVAQTGWLILFDNADDPDINLRQFFPRCKHGDILITTRNPDLRFYADSGSHYTIANESTPENQREARKIVQALHAFPLAVLQAGAFILKIRTLERYLDLYVDNQARLLAERPSQTPDDYSRSVYTTWQISFDRLSGVAARLLQVSSVLHHEGITEEICSKAVLFDSSIFGELGPTAEDLRDAREFLTEFTTSSGTWDPLVFLRSTAELQSYSLIEKDQWGKGYSIHPLVHSWTRDSVTDVRVRENALTILGMSTPRDRNVGIMISPWDLLNDHAVSYIIAESDANKALSNVFQGAVGIDTEFFPLVPTEQEPRIITALDSIGQSNRKAAILGWQIVELAMHNEFPVDPPLGDLASLVLYGLLLRLR